MPAGRVAKQLAAEGVSLAIRAHDPTVPTKSIPAASTPEQVDGAPESTCVRGTTNTATPAAETSDEVMSIGQVCVSSRGRLVGWPLFHPTVSLGERWFGVGALV